jgi:hypothetical protein
MESGDNVGNQEVLDHRNLIFQPQLPLLEPGNLELVIRPGAGQGIDRGVEIAVLDPEDFKPLAHFFFVHAAAPEIFILSHPMPIPSQGASGRFARQV